MSKSKVNVKKNYIIKKETKVMRMKEDNFEPMNYEVFKVSGPNGFKKYFCSRKDAKAFVDKHTDTKMTTEIVTNLLNEIKYK